MEQILEGFNSIKEAFLKDPSIWWFFIPIFLLWIGMEIYFGQYKKERLGWNSILANGISFSWINIAALRNLFINDFGSPDFLLRFIIVLIFFIYGLFIIYTAFFHKISPNLAAALAAPTPIYFLSAVSVLWGQGVLIINKWVFLDLIIVYLVLSLFFRLIRKKLGTLGEAEAIKKGERPE